MLTKEKKIIENLTTKEELHSFWTKVNHTPLQYANMEHLTHSEQPMEPKEFSQTSQDGLTMHHHSDHSESVTYQNTDTIELSDLTVLISKTQSKIL